MVEDPRAGADAAQTAAAIGRAQAALAAVLAELDRAAIAGRVAPCGDYRVHAARGRAEVALMALSLELRDAGVPMDRAEAELGRLHLGTVARCYGDVMGRYSHLKG